MDDASQAVVEQGGMPTGDEAEKALDVVTRRLVSGGHIYISNEQLEGIRRCLIAFLALMRMHEAKQDMQDDDFDCHCPENAELHCISVTCPRRLDG